MNIQTNVDSGVGRQVWDGTSPQEHLLTAVAEATQVFYEARAHVQPVVVAAVKAGWDEQTVATRGSLSVDDVRRLVNPNTVLSKKSVVAHRPDELPAVVVLKQLWDDNRPYAGPLLQACTCGEGTACTHEMRIIATKERLQHLAATEPTVDCVHGRPTQDGWVRLAELVYGTDLSQVIIWSAEEPSAIEPFQRWWAGRRYDPHLTPILITGKATASLSLLFLASPQTPAVSPSPAPVGSNLPTVTTAESDSHEKQDESRHSGAVAKEKPVSTSPPGISSPTIPRSLLEGIVTTALLTMLFASAWVFVEIPSATVLAAGVVAVLVGANLFAWVMVRFWSSGRRRPDKLTAAGMACALLTILLGAALAVITVVTTPAVHIL